MIHWTPPEVKDIDIAFGNASFLPKWDEIPEEFKRGGTKWNTLFHKLFYGGLPKDSEIVEKEGVDAMKAGRAIRAILGSYEPKHEHKEAGCAYLMSLWFDDWKISESA